MNMTKTFVHDRKDHTDKHTPFEHDRKCKTTTNIFWSYSPVQIYQLNDFFSFLSFPSYSPIQVGRLNDFFHLYFFSHIHRFFGQVQRLMFIGVIFGHVLTFTFVCVNFIWSYSNPFLVILIGSK